MPDITDPFDAPVPNWWHRLLWSWVFLLLALVLSLVGGTMIGTEFDARLFLKPDQLLDESYWDDVFLGYVGGFGVGALVLSVVCTSCSSLSVRKMTVLAASWVIVGWVAWLAVCVWLPASNPWWVQQATENQKRLSTACDIAIPLAVACSTIVFGKPIFEAIRVWGPAGETMPVPGGAKQPERRRQSTAGARHTRRSRAACRMSFRPSRRIQTARIPT
jgi:hypothetical protein